MRAVTSTPPFVPVELAARIERAEARLSAALGEIAAARRPETAFVQPIAGGVAVYTGPASPVSKMIGLGFSGLPSDEELAAIEAKFKARGAPLQAEVSTLADTTLGGTLNRRGYVLQGFENVLGRRLVAADGRPSAEAGAFDIRLADPDDFQAWIDVSVRGFGSPDLQGVP